MDRNNQFTGGMSPSMFETLSSPIHNMPDEAALAAAEIAEGKEPHAEISAVIVKTYDLSISEQVADYSKDMAMLLKGVAKRTHAVLAKEPLQFINGSDGARYIAHLQWAEFTFVEEKLTTTPVGKKASDATQES